MKPVACPLCTVGSQLHFRDIEDVAYLRCDTCGTILASPDFLEQTLSGDGRVYDDSYWADELSAARERGFGASLVRVAEVFYYARRPLRRFLDVSCGPGVLLDAVAELLPEISNTFWGIEPFPPPPQYRARHPQYQVGFLSDLEGRFDGGTCIEVIEHLPPVILKRIVADLAAKSEPGALWYFNSSQPYDILNVDPDYLDPYSRGHIASYSIEGLRPVFGSAGFTIHVLPGRHWAFLAEYCETKPLTTNDLFDRLWTMTPENNALLKSARFGQLMMTAGLEGARCYLESAMASWAVEELRKM